MIDDVKMFFFRFIESPESLHEWLRDAAGVYEDNGALIFTLRGLYTLISHTDGMSYEAFRSALYASDINALLSEKGYCIDVYKNSGKADRNWYALRAR